MRDFGGPDVRIVPLILCTAACLAFAAGPVLGSESDKSPTKAGKITVGFLIEVGQYHDETEGTGFCSTLEMQVGYPIGLGDDWSGRSVAGVMGGDAQVPWSFYLSPMLFRRAWAIGKSAWSHVGVAVGPEFMYAYTQRVISAHGGLPAYAPQTEGLAVAATVALDWTLRFGLQLELAGRAGYLVPLEEIEPGGLVAGWTVGIGYVF